MGFIYGRAIGIHTQLTQNSPPTQLKTRLQRGACVKFSIRHTNLQVAESTEASFFFNYFIQLFFFFNLKAQNRLHVVLSEVSPWLALK